MISQHHSLRVSDLAAFRTEDVRAHHAPAQIRLTYNARGALYQLLESLEREAGDTVLLPACHCVALVEPVLRAGYKVCYYRVRSDFSVDLDDLQRKLTPATAATVAVHFFGFPAEIDAMAPLVKAHGAYMVEDCAHSFLSRSGPEPVGRRGDFALFSYYKLAPCLVGGSLVANRPTPRLRPTTRLPWYQRLVLTKRLLEQAARNAPRNPAGAMLLWLDRIRINWKKRRGANAPGPVHAPSAFLDDAFSFRKDLALAAMPWLCRCILEFCDWEHIARRRRENYRMLSQLIRDSVGIACPFPDLPDNVVPFAFPAFLSDRVTHERALRERGIPFFTFGAPLHPSLRAWEDSARRDAEIISRQLILFPVHQQLDAHDMRSYGEELARYVDDAA
jgi:dTDP-4-amino-4,6-dideoxygalactose transaminase